MHIHDKMIDNNTYIATVNIYKIVSLLLNISEFVFLQKKKTRMKCDFKKQTKEKYL